MEFTVERGEIKKTIFYLVNGYGKNAARNNSTEAAKLLLEDNAEIEEELCQISMMELFCENS